MDVGIPDKLYMKIGEVSAIVGLPSSVLRFWETEFDVLKPRKSPTGQRLYTKQDIELISEIKKLLHVEKLTIEGARKRLADKKRQAAGEPAGEPLIGLLRQVRDELLSIRDQL